MHPPRKRTYSKGYREFESPPLRHLNIQTSPILFIKLNKNNTLRRNYVQGDAVRVYCIRILKVVQNGGISFSTTGDTTTWQPARRRIRHVQTPHAPKRLTSISCTTGALSVDLPERKEILAAEIPAIGQRKAGALGVYPRVGDVIVVAQW